MNLRTAGQATGRAVSRTLAAAKRAYQAGKQLATDKRIPRWIRCLLVIGMIQTPLPVDEIALAIALPALLLFYRQPLRDALATARGK